MGTPSFAVPLLRKLARENTTSRSSARAPTRYRSRGKKLEPSPVKDGGPRARTSRARGQPHEAPRIPAALRAVEADVFCVAAYGCILSGPRSHHGSAGLRERPRVAARPAGAVRHAHPALPSLKAMPRPVYPSCASATASTRAPIAPRRPAPSPERPPTSSLLNSRSSGAICSSRTLPALADGTAVWTEQDEALVTHAAKTRGELRLDPADERDRDERCVACFASSDAAHRRAARSPAGPRASLLPHVERGRPDVAPGELVVTGRAGVSWAAPTAPLSFFSVQARRQTRDGRQVLGCRSARGARCLGSS